MDYSEIPQSKEIVNEELRIAYMNLAKAWEEWDCYATFIELGYNKTDHDRMCLYAKLYKAIEAADTAKHAVENLYDHLKFYEKEESKS